MHPWLQQPEPQALRVPSVHGSSQSILSDGFGSQDSVRTLRRSASKSREVLCEKVTNSQLKKNISKSRERLCDLKFGLSKSRERLARTVLAGGVSRSSEVLGNRPPWRAAGLNCPLGKPLPPPMERMGSFKVRDQYQSQVVAGLGSSQSLNTSGQPFVRSCSLRGKKKSSPPAAEPTDFRASLRRNKKNTGRRNSLQDSRSEREDERQRETRRRSHSTRDDPEPVPRLERRRDSHGRRELSAPPDESKNMIIVEIISDDEQDVFTRLYNDRLKDSELKWRKLRDTDYDDEKENKATNAHLNVRRPRIERSRSRDSTRSWRGSTKGGSGSDETLSERIEKLDETFTERIEKVEPESLQMLESPTEETRPADPDTSRENVWSSADSQQGKPISRENTWGSVDSQQVKDDDVFQGANEEKTVSSPPSSEKSSDEKCSSSESLQNQTPESETINSQTHAVESETLESQQSRRESADSVMSTKNDIPSTEEVTSQHLAESQKPGSSENVSTNSVESMATSRNSSASPERRIEPYLDRVPESSAPWRRTDPESPQRWRRPASSSPEPGAEPRRRRQGSASVTAERSVNTDVVSTRDRGINTDSVLLAAVETPTSPRWERAENLPTPVVTTLRDVFERSARAHPESAQRQSSVPPTSVTAAATGLAKSPTEEDVRARGERLQRSERRAEADEKRSVAFVEADLPSRKSSAGCYRRCSSLSSDLGSSEMSSEAGSESYCVLSWEEATSDQATELKPVLSTRSAGRPRSHSQQLAQLELAKLRQRGRSHSVVTEPFGAAQPWGQLCSGSVARAFEKFHSMAGDSRKRRQSSPNIVALGTKVSDLGEV